MCTISVSRNDTDLAVKLSVAKSARAHKRETRNEKRNRGSKRRSKWILEKDAVSEEKEERACPVRSQMKRLLNKPACEADWIQKKMQKEDCVAG